MFKTVTISKCRTLVLAFGLIFCSNIIQAQKIVQLQQGKSTSIRGLSVVNDKIAWVSGSKGHVALSTDSGKTWNWQQVKGYEQSDFRDVEAFSAKEAIVMSSGTPAYILKTTDGGATWDLKYKNDDKAYFLDAMDFIGKKHGFILGDPINNKFLLLETNDAGNTWHPFISQPDAIAGEAAFAASGTCLRVTNKSIHIVTGGKVTRSLTCNLKGTKWIANDLPIKHGKDSQGAFSTDQQGFIFVGGDYTKDKSTDSVACYFDRNLSGVYTWLLPINNGPAGYQSCVEEVMDKFFLSTGTSGSNISTDGGRTWQQIDTISYNVCRKAKKGKLVLLAGDRGKIGILHF